MDAPFSVTGLTERDRINPDGSFKNLTVIYLQTVNGASGSVEIPTAVYMAMTDSEDGKAQLRQTLQEKANSLDAAFSM
jgi:hypothetical protein